MYEGSDFRNFPNFRIDKFAIDAQGNFIFGNALLRQVQKLTPGGSITTIAGTGNSGGGGDGGPALSADLSSIQDVEVDALNNIYVLANNRIRKISPGGYMTAVAGSNTFPNGGYVDANSLNAFFVGVSGLAMSPDQTALYVADPGNSGGYGTIRKVSVITFNP